MTDATAEFDSDKLIDFLKFSAATVDTAASQLGCVDTHRSPQKRP
jgi:hypothetical protein